MSEIGALIVKLQAETAEFRSDMGKVKGDLDDLKDKGGDAGRGLSSGMGEARGGLMLVEESVGVKLPRHLNSLIAQIPGVGAAFAMMLPIAGVVVAIEIVAKLIEKHNELKKEVEASARAQIELGVASNNTLSSLNEKLIQAGNQADELHHNHLAALKKQLELIDLQSMDDLEHTFDELNSKALATLSTIKKAWFWSSDSSEGAKASLQGFSTEYDALMSKAKLAQSKADVLPKGTAQIEAQKEANSLLDQANQKLDVKLKWEQDTYDFMKIASEDEANAGVHKLMIEAARDELQRRKAGYGEKELQSESAVLDVLQTQVAARETINATANVKKHTVIDKGDLETLAEQAAYQKVLTSGVEQHSQALIKLARTQAETTMAGTKGGEDDNIDGKLAKQMAAIEAEKDDSIAASKASLVAKAADYDSDMKAAGGNAAKKRELTAQWANEVHAYSDAVVQFNADADRQIVAADRAAANERAAIAKALQAATADDAMKAAISAAERQKKVSEQYTKDEAALHHKTEAQTLAAELAANSAEINAEKTAYQTRINNLDKFDKDYEKKVKELNDKIKELTVKGQDDETQIIKTAAQKQAMEIKSSEDKMKEAVASDVANSIVMNKSLAASFRQTGEQMAEQMIKNTILMALEHNKQKLDSAKSAAHKAYDAMSGIPPAPLWGIVAGAAAFAGVMSFEVGGKIPGEGAVPIVGHGGETVVTKALTDRVESAEKSGGKSGGQHTWNFAPTVHAMDAEGVDRVLTRHSTVFQRHVAQTMRRMNH
jgi:hypothetical protein